MLLKIDRLELHLGMCEQDLLDLAEVLKQALRWVCLDAVINGICGFRESGIDFLDKKEHRPGCFHTFLDLGC